MNPTDIAFTLLCNEVQSSCGINLTKVLPLEKTITRRASILSFGKKILQRSNSMNQIKDSRDYYYAEYTKDDIIKQLILVSNDITRFRVLVLYYLVKKGKDLIKDVGLYTIIKENLTDNGKKHVMLDILLYYVKTHPRILLKYSNLFNMDITVQDVQHCLSIYKHGKVTEHVYPFRMLSRSEIVVKLNEYSNGVFEDTFIKNKLYPTGMWLYVCCLPGLNVPGLPLELYNEDNSKDYINKVFSGYSNVKIDSSADGITNITIDKTSFIVHERKMSDIVSNRKSSIEKAFLKEELCGTADFFLSLITRVIILYNEGHLNLFRTGFHQVAVPL
ncbi:hypothetical protein E6Q11_04715 [Candidatus Dojkabacteria bacterium]|uniref:Uncharacterized protein n=1 Tax=Candidatus Dojkabacteria bacterium TaxID=2099670 RepID=A0A5C7J4T9_9BACT|nr:MAG: hypothetical protein E6Q11_04715 [Candidatus Dojkabacteria bacterium]